MGYKMKICFLLTHIPDPKTNKRIKAFKEYGETSVICTRRKSQDIWEPAFDDVKHYIFDIDLPTVKHIIKRFVISRGYQKKAIRKIKEENPNVIYADGLDSLLIASNYKKNCPTKVFYDIADLRETYIEEPKQIIKRIINCVIKRVEKRCFKDVDYLVITSPKFYSVYYYRLIDKSNVIYIPNVPDKEVFDGYVKKNRGDFTIGFIGGIRYLEQMKMLVDAAGLCGFKVLFAGAGGTATDYEEILRYCTGKDYVKFTGKYNYKKEIADLYGQVDCVYAVYDADNPNVRIALPNKLYESVYCKLPIIVAKGTYLSELVEEWGVGLSVHHNRKDELCEVLCKLAADDTLRNQIEENCNIISNKINFDSYKFRLIDRVK